METLREYINFYRKLGFSIVPLKYGDKVPDASVLPNRKWEPYMHRKPTDEEITRWFFSGKKRNVGIVLGFVSNNLFVIDLDSPELVDYVKSKMPKLFEATLVVKTSRGVHLYFRANRPIRTMKFQHKLGEIDIKGEGGYVVAPPSLHPSGAQYEIINKTEPLEAYGKIGDTYDALRELFKRLFPDLLPELEQKLGISKPAVSTQKINFPDMPPCLKKLLNGVPEGIRNESCFLLSAYLTKILPVENVKDLMLAWNSRNDPPLPEKEVLRTVESASRYEISCAAIKRRISVSPELCNACKYKSFMKPAKELYEIEAKEVEMEMTPTPKELQSVVFVPQLRSGQLEVLKELLPAKDTNIILKAPTGFGKTILFLAKAKIEAPAIIVEPYRALQDQLAEKYGLFVIKGKSNYKCPVYNTTVDIAPCNYRSVDCDDTKCPYYAAIHRANEILKQRGIIVTNHGNYYKFARNANIIIFDEFHRILEEITESIKLRHVTKEDLKQLPFDELLGKEILAIDNEIEVLKEEIRNYEVGTEEYTKLAKKINRLRRRREKLEFIHENIDHAFAYWREDNGKGAVYVKLDEEAVFKRILQWDKKKLFVSATPLTAEDVKVIEANANFINKQNAPIIYLPVEKLTYWSVKEDEGKLKLAADFIKMFYGYLKNNGKTKKAIVHSGNIHLHGRKLAKFLQPYKVILHEKGKLDETLKTFKESDANFLIIASGDVGFDFYGYDYTLQFIAKVPYPTWDEEWQARLKKFGKEKTERFYNKKTVDTILQICGRICRGGDDIGYTIILDSKFEDLFRDYYEFFDENFKSRLIDLSPNRVLEQIMRERGDMNEENKTDETD